MKNLAIVGIGKWGKNLINEFSKNSNIIMCQSTGNKKNIEWVNKNFPNIQHTKNFEDILNNKLIDAVVIASPIKTHFFLSTQVILAQKHLFVEKPMSMNFNDTKKLVNLAKNQNVVLFVGHIFLYHPVLEKIKKILQTESLVYLKFNWNKLGSFKENILLDLVSHFISIIIELLGLPNHIKIIDTMKILTSNDMITMEFKFNTSCKCIVDINRVSNFKKRSVMIVTTKNTFQWDDENFYKFNKKLLSYKQISVSKKPSLQIECQQFIKNLDNTNDNTNINKSLKIAKLTEKCIKMIK